MPANQREALVAGSYDRLVIVPDGALALLPFDALVVDEDEGQETRHLLDVGPPLMYGPSASVLWNLVERASAEIGDQPVSLLTVGVPHYDAIDSPAQPNQVGGILSELAASARFQASAGPLRQLPFSGLESQWVAEAFAKTGTQVLSLVDARASEGNVRQQAPGRRIIHLACHGLADDSYGNFFGALALTQPAHHTAEPADDGFLTLGEIYELRLDGCELAILSACETNYGPEQQSEGVWALSRGFLAAGSRRVVASNWLVDNEAAASLMREFCTLVAADRRGSNKLPYAKALHEAKRKIRQQQKWADPYYWGSFVLIGPD